MSKITFTAELATGIKAIDDDHKLLIEILNTLDDEIDGESSVEVIGGTLEALRRYVEEHFNREESIMEHYGYPELGAHMRQHQQLMYSAHLILRKFHDTPEKVKLVELHAFLCHWVAGHIMGADKALAQFIRQPSVKPLDKPPASELKAITVRIPPDQIATILRCATILAEGSAGSAALVEFIETLDKG